jgi:hypothetical protein
LLSLVAEDRDRRGGITRRQVLRLGVLGGLTLGALPHLSSGIRSSLTPGFGKAKSVLLVYTSGGQSQIDTWDPKPDAPAEIRGAFRPIATSVPGTRVCEHLPRLARLAHTFTILRSVSHDDLDHGSATYLALTGQFAPRKSSNPPPRPTDHPTYGAILKRVRPAPRLPYSSVYLNGPLLIPENISPGLYGGLLGRAYDPLIVGDVTQDVAGLRGLDLLPELPPVRLARRRSLLQSLEAYHHKLGQDRLGLEQSTLRRQAYDLLGSPHIRLAFDLGREPQVVRQRYGLHRSGQACLLARRLVEAGMPFVTVLFNHNIRGQDKDPEHTDSYGWDTHNDIFDSLQHHLLPRFDQSFTTLLTDLAQRGLLDQTLVVCMGEFGRAPVVALEKNFAGSSPGRKHWAAVYSIVLAGAGVARGAVVGSSDRHGAYPHTHPVGPADVAATLFAALGIDPAGHYRDPLDRPFRIAEGKPIRALYG